MTDHVQIQEAIAAYVMHSIDPDDRARSALSALAVVSDPRAHRAALQGARGSLVVSVLPDGTGVLIAQGMGAPPSGSVYELWLAKDARYIPVRTFSPDGGDVVLP